MNTYRITFASLYCKITITVIADCIEHALDVAEYDRATLFPDCTIIGYDEIKSDDAPDTIRETTAAPSLE